MNRRFSHPDREALVTLYKEMEFRQWLGELLEGKDEGVDDVKGGEPAPASAEATESDAEGSSAGLSKFPPIGVASCGKR